MNNPVLAKLHDEYKRSPLLQYAPALIVVILTVYVISLLWERNEALEQEYRRLSVSEARLQNVSQQADWEALATQAAAQAERLDARIWQAESTELASADVQTAIQNLVRDRVEALRINIASPIFQEEAGSWKLSVEVGGRFVSDSVPLILVSIAEHQPALVLERFEYGRSRNHVGTLHLSALVHVLDSSGQAEAVN